MKNVKNIFIGILLIFALFAGVSGAVTTVPAGSVNSYSLSTAGETYELAGNVASADVCFVFAADNVTLDGKGYNITYCNNFSGYAIYANGRNNVTIKNCNIIKTNDAQSNSPGIKLNNTYNSHIENITFTSGNSNAVYTTGANNNTVTNLSASIAGSIPIALANSSNNTFDRITLNTSSVSGLYIQSTSRGNIIKNSIISSVSGKAVYIDTGCNGTQLQHVIVSSNTNNAIYSYVSADCVYDYVTANSQNTSALYILNSNNVTISNSRLESVTSNSSYGLLLYYSTNCTGSNLTCISGEWDAIKLPGCSGCTFSDVTVISPRGSAPHANNKILCVGDSITDGNYGQYIQSNLDSANVGTYFVSIQGVGGEDSIAIKNRFNATLEIFDPDIVTVMAGTNDITHGVSQQTTIDNILWMCDSAEKHGMTPVILLVIPKSDTTTQIALDNNLTTQATAEGYKIINTFDAVDTLPENGDYDSYDSQYSLDGTHPNTLGNQRIAEKVFSGFVSLGIVSEIPVSEWDNVGTSDSDTWIFALGMIGVIVLVHFVSRLIKSISGFSEEGGDGIGGLSWIQIDLMFLLVIIVTMGTLTYVLDSIHF